MILRKNTPILVITLLFLSHYQLLTVEAEDKVETVDEPTLKEDAEVSDSNRRSFYAEPDNHERGGSFGREPSAPRFTSYNNNNYDNSLSGRFPVRNQVIDQGGIPNNVLNEQPPPFVAAGPLPPALPNLPHQSNPNLPYQSNPNLPHQSNPALLQSITDLRQQPQNMPQVVGIDVQCSKEAMLVRVRFNVDFNGVIYAKGHFRNPDCRYVRVNGAQTTYEFTVQHDRCGTTFTDNFRNGGQAYLENTIIIQMEPGIQEVWDAARRIRCLWNGLFQKTVSSRLNVDMLDIVSITYSGDAVDTYMDIQIGQGPNAPVATGLVKIGETLTLVVYVLGSNDLDVHVRECFAFSTDRSYSIQLTDSNGCVIKKKLMGPWLTTTNTQGLGGIGSNSGASIISYAFLQAFKFPDTMDVNLECNVIICKYKCRTECPGNIRSKREVPTEDYSRTDQRQANSTSPAVTLVRTIRVLSPDDIPISINSNDTSSVVTLQDGTHPTLHTGTDIFGDDRNAICMSTPTFIIALVIIMIIMIISCVLTALLCIRMRNNPSANKSSSLTRRTLTRPIRTPTPLLTSTSSNA